MHVRHPPQMGVRKGGGGGGGGGGGVDGFIGNYL